MLNNILNFILYSNDLYNFFISFYYVYGDELHCLSLFTGFFHCRVIVGFIVIYCGDNKIIMYEYSKYNTIYISIIRIILD